MKNQDSTEKGVKMPSGDEAAATPEAGKATGTGKELTDEQLAAVIGGGKMAPDFTKKT